MQTPQVSNSANLLAAGPSGAKPAQPGTAGAEGFGQALSREVAGRDAAAKADPRPEPAQQATPAKPDGTSAEKSAQAEADASRQEAAATDAQSQFSSDILALVAAINSIAPRQEPALDTSDAGIPADGKGATDARGIAALLRDAGAAAQATGQGEIETGTDEPGAAVAQLHAAAAPMAAGTDAADAGAELTEFATAMQEAATTINHATAPQLALQAARQLPAAAAEKLTPAVGTPAWDQALGQKVVWMVAGEQQSASLTLNPPDLGPLQVVLNVSNSQASATFSAAQPEVRQALEAALPRLRDMLGEAGIELGQASVNSGQPNQAGDDRRQAAQGGNRGGTADGGVADGDAQARTARVQPAASGLGLVDTFA